MKIRMIEQGHYTAQCEMLYGQLLAHPEVWDTIRLRTFHPNSPHREISDIWVRYNAFENFNGDIRKFNAAHESVWYPVADVLPAAKTLSESLECDALGAVLITRIPPSKRVYPHVDEGWHARTYEKFAFQILGDTQQCFHVEDESLVTRTGDLFWFDNSFSHWVVNDSSEDRITLIVCIRRGKSCH